MRTTTALLALGLIGASPPPLPSPPPYPCTNLLSVVTRPSVTTSVCTVPSRAALIETGYTNTTLTGTGAGNAINFPQAFLRIGSGDPKFEYEFTPPSIAVTNAGGSVTRGATDAGAGVKYVLGYSSNASWGINALATLPSGSSQFTAGYAQYAANFNWTYTVNPTIGLAGTLGFNSLSGANAAGTPQRYLAFVPSLELTAAFPGNSEFFVEYTFFSASGPATGGRSLVDFGIARDIGQQFQLDIEGGIQPTTINGQRSHYVGAGISFMN